MRRLHLLPEGPLTQILTPLDLVDVLNLRLACKAFRQHIDLPPRKKEVSLYLHYRRGLARALNDMNNALYASVEEVKELRNAAINGGGAAVLPDLWPLLRDLLAPQGWTLADSWGFEQAVLTHSFPLGPRGLHMELRVSVFFEQHGCKLNIVELHARLPGDVAQALFLTRTIFVTLDDFPPWQRGSLMSVAIGITTDDVHLLTRLGIEYTPALRALYTIFTTTVFAPPTPRVRVPPMFKPWPQSLITVV